MLYYKKHGSGPPIVLIHGFTTDGFYWKPVVQRLAKSHTVIVVDLQGFGKSPKSAKLDYTLDGSVTALGETLESVVKEPAIVIGHSMGTLISARLAAMYPALVSRLILLNPPIASSAEQMRESLIATGITYRLFLYSRMAPVFWPFIKIGIRIVRLLGMKGILRYMSTKHSNASRQGSLRLIETARIGALLEPLSLPIAIVHGKYDRPDYFRHMATIPAKSNISHTTVPTGHHTIYQQPDALYALIDEKG